MKNLYSALIEQGASLVALMVKNLPAMQKTQVQSLAQEDILVKGNTPVFYSYLEDSTDREAWHVTVHGVTESWIWLSNYHFHF